MVTEQDTTEAAEPTVVPLTRAQLARRIADAIRDREAGMALADANASDWDKALIDQAIEWFAQTGELFSANDVRRALPDDINARGLMGARFGVAFQRTQIISPVSTTPSSKRNTHGKGIGVWIGTAFAEERERASIARHHAEAQHLAAVIAEHPTRATR